MTKRKRPITANGSDFTDPNSSKKSKGNQGNGIDSTSQANPLAIQVVTGSYDRVLHGFTATVRSQERVEFADNFLFNAHTSAIRCLAISPPSAPLPGQAQKVLLASGSTDERINVYNLSAHTPSSHDEKFIVSVGPRPILENPKNRELGTLLHHSSTITKLSFPSRSRLLSCSEDSTIGVTRTRDWNLLSTIKAPIPKPQGRPSGDTAPFGGTPSGINDFAIDPSMKVMISVSKGEKCMRLWNLMTGKKAGVLNFGRETLAEVGEGRHSTGEARRIIWGSATDEAEFCVGFDRDIVVFNMSALPKCRIMGDIRTKVHRFRYVSGDTATDPSLLAVSTEDGRILFFSTSVTKIDESDSPQERGRLPVAKLVAQLGGKDQGVSGRIKDFAVIETDHFGSRRVFVIGGSSDGKVRMWDLDLDILKKPFSEKILQAGKLLGTYETQNRITCLVAFAMVPRPDGADSEDEDKSGESEDLSEDEEGD